MKLSKNKFVSELDAWAVDIDYNSTIYIIEQINTRVISVIKRIQGPVLNFMCLYGMQDISSFCGTIESISDVCSIYHTISKQKDMKLGNIKVPDDELKRNEEEMMKCLTDLALDFNAGKGNNTNSDNTESMNLTAIVDNVMQTDTSNVEEFDVNFFLKFISNDFRKNNIGNMLHCMTESMTANFGKQKVQGKISSL